MSPTDPAPPAADAPRLAASPVGRAAQPGRSGDARRGGATVAVLLSLIAVAGAGYVGWSQWQQQQASAGEHGALAQLQQQSDALKVSLAAVSDQRSSLDQRLTDAAQVNGTLRDEVLGQAERTRSVEDAVAKLTEKTLSGHDTVLLDETDSLLRMGDQRYTLFHDAQGAAAAYALASQTLAAVNDVAFSGVRQSIDAERDALLKSQPLSQDAALRQLGMLRDELASWPLKPLDAPLSGRSVAGPWSRITHALTAVISVQRDNGAPLAVADGRLTRELVALDLAQAQAALLAHDASGYAAALQRVDSNLASQFDTAAPAVQQARAVLSQQAAALPLGTPVKLGAALTELRNLRTVHALRSDAAPAPAPAASSARAAGRARS